MTKTIQVFLACFLGGLIGGAIALQYIESFFWVGFIVGGVISYVAYDFGVIWRTIPRAYKYATSWEPNTKMWRLRFFCLYWNFLSITLSPIGSVALALMTGCLYLSDISIAYSFLYGFLLTFGSTLFFLLILMYLDDSEKELKFQINGAKKALPKYNMLVLSVLLINKMWHSHPVQRTGKILNGIGRFFKYLFIEVYTHERVLCLVYGSIGAITGYYYGNAILGAVVGGIFGVLNYEIISKRVLKLNPLTQ